MSYKLGRLPRDTSRWAPTLEDYYRPHPMAAAGLPPVANSAKVDYASKVTDWPMYCNGPDSGNPPASPDGVGDCAIAEIAHAYTALDVYADKPQVLFNDSEIIAVYSRNSGYNPKTGANDNGCQLQDVLADQRKNGMVDAKGTTHKVAAYAALGNPTDITMLSEVLYTFGFVYVGINIPDQAMSTFGPGTVWTYWPGSPIDGGHCVGLHSRDPYGSRVGVFGLECWGVDAQWSTISFIENYVEEAWAVFTEDWVEANGSATNGLALAQLEADMKYV